MVAWDNQSVEPEVQDKDDEEGSSEGVGEEAGWWVGVGG